MSCLFTAIRRTMILRVSLFILSSLSFSSGAKVSLNSSAARVCPGDTLVFTCVTNTSSLLWNMNGTTQNSFFYEQEQLQSTETLDIFSINLISITGTTFVSTATVHNVSIEDDKTIITCSDSNQVEKSAEVNLSDVPSLPLNLISTCPSLGSVNISWVAPLDTPLCVHSYTVTVRNSSQVMVYNTTDNRSSLSITDLTSDGEYSVTVAGRDGAGRLGQESEDLNVLLREKKSITNFTSQTVFMSSSTYGVLLSWNYSKQSHFLIHHNVSSDQRSIRIDRPRLTLYGVQQGETYSVKIILLTSAGNYGKNFSFKIAEATSIPDSDEQECPPEWKSENPGSDLSVGYIASILGSAVLMFVITCYLLMCVFTKFYVPGKEACMRDHGDVNLFLLKQPGDEARIIKEVGAAAEGVEENTTQSVPEYDYVCHQ